MATQFEIHFDSAGSVTSTQATTTTAGTSVTEDTEPVMTTAGRFATGVPLTAEDLQERRRTLMRMLAEQSDTRSGEIQQARALDWMEQAEEEVRVRSGLCSLTVL